MSLQLSLLLGDSHCFPNAYVWMPIVGSLATASRWKPRLAEARLTLNLYFSLQEKGHSSELMTEQCSEMFDYPALYLCLLPPTVFSFPGHGDFFLLCYLFSFRWGFTAQTVADRDTTGTSTEPWTLVLHFNYVKSNHRPDFLLPHHKLLCYLLNFQWVNNFQNSRLKSQTLLTNHFDKVLA